MCALLEWFGVKAFLEQSASLTLVKSFDRIAGYFSVHPLKMLHRIRRLYEQEAHGVRSQMLSVPGEMRSSLLERDPSVVTESATID
jgi:hypothetical protein